MVIFFSVHGWLYVFQYIDDLIFCTDHLAGHIRCNVVGVRACLCVRVFVSGWLGGRGWRDVRDKGKGGEKLRAGTGHIGDRCGARRSRIIGVRRRHPAPPNSFKMTCLQTLALKVRQDNWTRCLDINDYDTSQL